MLPKNIFFLEEKCSITSQHGLFFKEQEAVSSHTSELIKETAGSSHQGSRGRNEVKKNYILEILKIMSS